MKVIIFISPPAAGKGTISTLLSEKYNYPHISVGQILRAQAPNDGELNQIISNGNLADIDIIMKILSKRLSEQDCENGYILDGFPRSIEQAEYYEKYITSLNVDLYVFVLNVDYSVAKERSLNRLVCSTNGEVFNKDLISEKDGSKYDECLGPLVKRQDDTEEVFDKRYRAYLETSEELINFYKEKARVFHVDANREVREVFNEITKILEGEIL